MINVTAIIVSYNTADLLKKCYESIRKFYPYMHCIIVDGSDKNNACYDYARSRSQIINTTISVGKNIGHGPGMKIGIDLVKTEYFLLIDSDVTIDRSGVIEKMMELLLADLEIRRGYHKLENRITHCDTGTCFNYGIGQLVYVNELGHDAKREMKVNGNTLEISTPSAITYLHPHFALINKSEYLKYEPIINHGAPMLKSMKSISNSNSHLVWFPVFEYITHHERGTRKLNPLGFHPKFWDIL